jgi:hypothetical protein
MMDRISARRAPGWYWLVAFLGLLWEAFGCVIFVTIWRDTEPNGYSVMPSWLFILFGVAVFSGLAGAIGLVLRQRWATLLLGLSLLAAVIHYAYIAITYGIPSESLVMVASVVGAGLLLVIVASAAGSRGWLR